MVNQVHEMMLYLKLRPAEKTHRPVEQYSEVVSKGKTWQYIKCNSSLINI